MFRSVMSRMKEFTNKNFFRKEQPKPSVYRDESPRAHLVEEVERFGMRRRAWRLKKNRARMTRESRRRNRG